MEANDYDTDDVPNGGPTSTVERVNEPPVEPNKVRIVPKEPEKPDRFHVEEDEVDYDPNEKAEIPVVSWFRQLWVAIWYKNIPLIQRKPFHLLLLLSSGMAAVLTAWPAARDYTASEAIYPETLTECGTVPLDFFNFTDDSDDSYERDSKVQLSLNEKWRRGLPVAIMCLGPMVFAICVYMIVHEEIQLHMLGVLRGLGMRDSVYWVSWYIPFAALALVNAILAAAAAKSVPVHAFEATYFGAILVAFFVLKLALMGASFFLATVSGTAKRGSVWLILLMIIPLWVPYIAMNVGFYGVSARDLAQGYTYGLGSTGSGLFWLNRETRQVEMLYPDWNGPSRQNDDVFGNGTETVSATDSSGTFETNDTANDDMFYNAPYVPNVTMCNIPLVSASEGARLKTTAESDQVSPNDIFIGCYFQPSFGASAWTPSTDKPRGKVWLAVWTAIPYFHFYTIWGNICGFTGNRNAEFRREHAGMNAGQLAREALPLSNFDAGSSFLAAGSMVRQSTLVSYPNCEYEYIAEINGFGCVNPITTCPSRNVSRGEFQLCSRMGELCATPEVVDGVSVNAVFVMLLALSLFYVFLAAYWGIVFVGGAGSYPFYFFLLPSYWLGGKRSNASAGDHGDSEAGTGSATSRGGAIKLHNVSKSYGTVQALKPISFEMARGEVTALLGHNGAGKTTLSKLLTCEFGATTGDITVFGHSVKDDPFTVRRMVGNCKQDDYLWPNLTAKEHLDIVGGLRGVDPDEHEEMVQKWLESVDLDAVQHQCSSQFSGGMKRRLSLALSTIGARLLIVLDEPTTGMDPVNRRYVWKHIDEIKKGRVVLLTTHAMEEADLLADMVAIMRKGELAAWGSPLQLKAEHGSALQFTALVEKGRVTSAVAAIGKHFAGNDKWIHVDAGESGNITVTIQKIQQGDSREGVSVDLLTSFVAWLESPTESGVLEYGFSNSSLEEVFLKVTEGDVEDETEIHIQAQDGQTVVMHTDAMQSDNAEGGRVALEEYKPNLSVPRQILALVSFNFAKTWTGRRSMGVWITYGTFVALSTIMILWLSVAETAILVVPVVFVSFILLSACSGIYGDRAEGLFYLMQANGLLKTSYLAATALYALVIGFVYSLVLLTILYMAPLFQVPKECTPNYAINDYCDSYPGFGGPRRVDITNLPQVTIPDSWLPANLETPVEFYAYASPGGYSMIFGAIILFALAIPGAALCSSFLPGHKFALIAVACCVLAAGVTPIIVFFLTELGVVVLENERDQLTCLQNIVPDYNTTCLGISQLAEVSGEDFLNCVGLQINKLNTFCFPPYVGLLPQFGLFQMLSLTLNANIKFRSEPSGFVDQFLAPKITGAYCSGGICSFPVVQNLYWQHALWELLGAFILILVGVIVAMVAAFPNATIQHFYHGVQHLWSSLSCSRGKGSKNAQAPNKASEELEEVVHEREIVHSIVAPLLRDPGDDPEINVTEQAEKAPAEGPVIADHASLPREDLPPILMHKLTKVYPSFGRLPPKIALKSLDLHVTKGQVLGFLGKNGAGKTTALKILAGAHEATSGIGLVSGFDVGCERIKVFECLGNCAQFDVIWSKVTVKEHLVFFGKLKGLPNDKVQHACQSIASAVGLGAPEVYNRNAGALSGGMRRRLSIAISLLGAPSVLVLDEPTTGLDPSTRNNIWDLINSFSTDERATVITTHMMLEADTLCNNIAIVSKGELVVVATQQRLKDKFGSGYLLQLNLVKSTPTNQKLAMDFVHQYLHEDAVLGTKHAKTLHVSLPRDLDLQKAFAALYSPTIRPDCINQFLMSQSSLEDVFLALGD